MNKKIKQQETELKELNEKVDIFQKYVRLQFDDILIKLRPQFTKSQIVGSAFACISLIAAASIYIESMKSDNRNNTTRLDYLEKLDEKENLQYQIIIESLSSIKLDVAVLKTKTENKDKNIESK